MPKAVMAAAMPQGTLLAFDFGTRRIGIAIGNSLSGTARPLTTLHGEKNEQRFGIEQGNSCSVGYV